ncbi:MAG: zinc metallopeptidase [Verrucomicrobiota bacterium]
MFYWVILGASMLVSWLVGQRLKSKFAQYSQVPMPMTGREIAEKMLRENGIDDVKVISTPGQLTDHYNPANRTVNLSEPVYHQATVAAAAVSAHEVGHAVQHAQAYSWLTMRSKLVPVVGIASKMMSTIFIISILGAGALNIPGLMWVFVAAMAMTTLFAFVTLPVEFDASKRAMVWIESSGLTSSMGQAQAKDALHWAAMTYVVAALASLAQLLYYLWLIFGRRN